MPPPDGSGVVAGGVACGATSQLCGLAQCVDKAVDAIPSIEPVIVETKAITLLVVYRATTTPTLESVEQYLENWSSTSVLLNWVVYYYGPDYHLPVQRVTTASSL